MKPVSWGLNQHFGSVFSRKTTA